MAGAPRWLSAMPPEFRARTAPPTVPGSLGAVARRSRWPGVIGSISLALGVLGVLGGAVGAASQLISSRIQSMVPGQEVVFDAQRKWMAESIGVQSAGALIAGLLIVAGAGLLMRRRWSRPVFFAWAILRVVGGIAAAMVTYGMQRDQFEAMSRMNPGAGGGPPPAVMTAVGDITVLATAVGYGLWAALWPAFMVVWLCRPKIRAEMSAWTHPPVRREGGVT